jgi:hypothetical protein
MRRAPRPATQGAATAAKALAVAASATVAAVALTFVVAGPAVAAAQAPRQAPATSAKVKYYIVPAPGHGSVPTLYSIAAATLGNGSLFMEIFNLNKGRLQPNGQRLENPHSVEPGWILLLPPSASGPGVHFGPLPTTAKATSRVVHRHPARSQATDASTTAASAGYGSGSLAETVIGGALLVVAAAGLGLVVRRRRRSGGSSRREPTHAMEAGPGADWVRSLAADTPGDTTGRWGGAPSGPNAPLDPGRPVTTTAYQDRPAGGDGHNWPYSDHLSWPANDPGRPVGNPGQPVGAAVGYGRTVGSDSPDWAYPDHPSWPANSPGQLLTPDHPSWPASNLGRPLTGDDYPSWPATDPGGGPAGEGDPYARPGGPSSDGGPLPGGGADLPRRERQGPAAAPAVHHDPVSGQAVAQVAPARGRHVRVPGGSAGETPQRWSAQLARSTGPIPQTYYDLDFGDGRLQVMLTETPGADPGWAGTGAHAGNMLQLPGPGVTGQPGSVSWDTGEYARSDSVRLAERVLADADQQAAAIRQEATSQAVAIRQGAEQEAAEIRQRAAAEAAPMREAAEQEAAEIRRQAAAQVAAIREAAEREIAELRATVLAMSDELTRVATYVTENLTSPGQPAVSPPRQAGPQTLTTPVQAPAEPDGKPSAEPDDKPPAKPAARPAGKPGAKRGARPATKPAGKPGTSGKPGSSVKGRQISAMHKMVAAFVAVSVVGVVAGSAEIARHGVPFFMFRNTGAGAGNSQDLNENQGPGQPDAPGTHHKTPGATPSATAKAHGHGAKANGHKSRTKHSQGKPRSNQPKGQQTPKPAKSN